MKHLFSQGITRKNLLHSVNINTDVNQSYSITYERRVYFYEISCLFLKQGYVGLYTECNDCAAMPAHLHGPANELIRGHSEDLCHIDALQHSPRPLQTLSRP